MTSPAERRLSDALQDIVASQPFEPDPAAIQRRGRILQRRATTVRIAGSGVAAVVVAGAVGATVLPSVLGGHSTHPVAHPVAHPATTGTAAPQPPLVQLAADLQAAPKPSGDATLVERDQNYTTGEHVVVWDLYGDNDTYYFAKTRDGMPAQVAGHKTQGEGVFGREVAAAEFAATGDLDTARAKMADAAGDPGSTTISKSGDKALVDSWIWGDSQDALTAGAGSPTVRAGVLRLLATLPEVTVSKTSTSGQGTLTLTNTDPAVKDGPKSSPSYTEMLIINADTGVPVAFHGGVDPKAPGINITYDVSRVTLADVAVGKF
jgi:hypothetical protein